MWSAFLWLHLQYTSLRKCQPTLLTQVVLCRDVSVEQEQGINVEARRLCVTSGQSGWGYCWAASAVPVICRTRCSNFLIHPSLVLFSCLQFYESARMIHRGMRTPCNDADSQRGMIKWDASHPKRWVSCRGIYSEHWIGIAKRTEQNNIGWTWLRVISIFCEMEEWQAFKNQGN